MANLYVEMDCYNKAIILYNECLNLTPDPKENPNLADLAISANYNLGIMYYIIDQYFNSKIKLETAMKIKRDIKREELSEQAAIIYETLGEIELEYKNFQPAYDHLNKAIEIRKRINLFEDKKTKLKIHILLDSIYQSLDKEFGRKNKHNQWFNQGILSKDEGDLDDMLNMIKRGNDESNEYEKFFLFVTKLSNEQIVILNETQSENESNLNLPVLFSMEFKSLLTNSQKLEVNNINQLSLRRNKILKDPRGKIEIDNLNYDIIQNGTIQNGLSTIKNYCVVSKLMKTSRLRSTNFDVKGSMVLSRASDPQKVEIENISENSKFMQNLEGSGNKSENKKFKQFKEEIVEYIHCECPEKEYLLNDAVILNLTNELSSDELSDLVKNPELLLEALDLYYQNMEDEYMDDSVEGEDFSIKNNINENENS
jgi:tetratricopeptide (TPR) repeat protein